MLRRSGEGTILVCEKWTEDTLTISTKKKKEKEKEKGAVVIEQNKTGRALSLYFFTTADAFSLSFSPLTLSL